MTRRLDKGMFFRDELSLQGTASLVLKSLLIKPIQRILKYPLLLRELVIVRKVHVNLGLYFDFFFQCTPDDHKDKLNLSEAAHEMSIVAQEVNERKRRKELGTNTGKNDLAVL